MKIRTPSCAPMPKLKFTRVPGRVLVQGLILAVLAASISMPARAQEHDAAPASVTESSAPEWLEPRGLSVLDLVGQVPEDYLRESILVFDEAGVTQYVSGQRNGDQVTIEVSMSSYLVTGFTEFVCLGRRPILDEWPVPVPPSEMRIFSAGADVTAQVDGKYRYHPAAQAEPIRGPNSSGRLERYFEYGFEGSSPADVEWIGSGAMAVPANMGCTFFLPGTHENLTAEFVFDYPQQIDVEVVGSEIFSFHSYIGVGDAGRIDSLADQMKRRFGIRHDKFALTVPEGADFVWVNYPPSSVSAYAAESGQLEHNIRLPSSGTYRLIGYGDTKSVDHVVSMGLPLHAQWMDADLSRGTWLERTAPIELLSSPEYFVPPGVAYDPCMREGNCDDALLEEIYTKEAQMKIYYFRVRRLRGSSLAMVPLYQVGPKWEPGVSPMMTAQMTDTTPIPPPPISINLPFVVMPKPSPTYPDDNPTEGCPCGWFDEYYGMLDVVPGL